MGTQQARMASNLGRGSRASFRLPAALSAAARAPHPARGRWRGCAQHDDGGGRRCCSGNQSMEGSILHPTARKNSEPTNRTHAVFLVFLYLCSLRQLAPPAKSITVTQ
ncbi:unnamed protein product [Urochloa humidicola]